MRALGTALIAASLGFAAPGFAQTSPFDRAISQSEVQTQAEGLLEVGRTAETGIGEVGQRQKDDQVAPNIEPLGRLNNRIQNRVQNRLRNRIDRNYDSTANAVAPFDRAEDQVKRMPKRR